MFAFGQLILSFKELLFPHALSRYIHNGFQAKHTPQWQTSARKIVRFQDASKWMRTYSLTQNARWTTQNVQGPKNKANLLDKSLPESYKAQHPLLRSRVAGWREQLNTNELRECKDGRCTRCSKRTWCRKINVTEDEQRNGNKCLHSTSHSRFFTQPDSYNDWIVAMTSSRRNTFRGTCPC